MSGPGWLPLKARTAAQPGNADVAMASYVPVPHVPPMPHVMPLSVVTFGDGITVQEAAPQWAAGYEHAPISALPPTPAAQLYPAGRP